MFPGLGILEKLFMVCLKLFVVKMEERRALKAAFDKFFKKSGEDSKKSVDLHENVDDIKKNWKNDEKPNL